jgi:hypothetical protein
MIPITTPAVEGLLCRGAPIKSRGLNAVIMFVEGEQAYALGDFVAGTQKIADLHLLLSDPVGLDIALRYLHLQNRPLEWARYLPLEVAATLVQAHLASVAAGGEGIQGLAGEWRGSPDWQFRQDLVNPKRAAATCVPDGWVIDSGKQGLETGAEGRAACDAALLAAGIALLDGETVRVPTPPARQPA